MCRDQLVELNESYEDIKALNAEIVAVSTDNLSDSQWVIDNVGLEYPILYDPEITTVADYGVFNLLGDELATSSTFLIDTNGVIRWFHAAEDLEDQVPTSTVLEQLRLLES